MKKILIVEDDEAIRTDIVQFLQFEGFKADEASNGKEGIEKAVTFNPDIIICDIAMPEKNGYQVLKELRQNTDTALTPFIFLTAKNSVLDRRKGMSEGADDYVSKPFAMKDLLNTITTRLNKQDEFFIKSEEKLRIFKENIVHTLPHELLTPLNGILGFTQLLSLNYHIMEREEIGEMAEIMYQSAERLNDTIQNYLLLAQLEIILLDASRLKTIRNRSMNNTALIIRKIADQTAALYKRQDDLIVDISNVTVKISENDFQKVMQELIDNAFKFSRRNEIVKITLIEEKNTCVIKIFNEGKGFEKNTVSQIKKNKKIGQLFQGKDGMGLGLLIVVRYMEIYNSDIEINSEPEKNAEVTLFIPKSV
ncbi:MAG: response regulator [Spirochaetia bacterium]|nr:response regulator [Spirochaetia bacterium]